MPERVQLSRAKGWRKPPNTVVVSRPNASWGNPYRVGARYTRDDGTPFVVETVEQAIELYREWVTPHANLIREELRGKNLACWCRLDKPCHADVLLEIANGN